MSRRNRPVSIHATAMPKGTVIRPRLQWRARWNQSQNGQVLASLYRAGPPYRRSPSRVARGLMLSGAGLTGRMDQLERIGLLQRSRDRDDRRAVVVELTPAGRRWVRVAFPEFVASHTRLLGQALEPGQRSALNALLRTVLQQVESSEPPGRA